MYLLHFACLPHKSNLLLKCGATAVCHKPVDMRASHSCDRYSDGSDVWALWSIDGVFIFVLVMFFLLSEKGVFTCGKGFNMFTSNLLIHQIRLDVFIY